MARDVAAPINHVHSDLSGRNAAAAATTPPVSGVDYGVPVYANLGSAVIPVSPSNVGVALNSYGQVSVLNTATVVKAANASRASIAITNISSSVTVYIGDASVTSSTGHALLPSQTISLPVVSAVYGIVATGTQTVTYLELQ